MFIIIVAVLTFVILFSGICIFISQMTSMSEVEFRLTLHILKLKALKQWALERKYGRRMKTVRVIDGKSSVHRTEDIEVYLAIEAGDKNRLLDTLQKQIISFKQFKHSMTPLQLAIYLGQHELIAPLMAHDCNTKNASLMLSESPKPLQCLHELKKFKIDMNERDNMERTVLHMAVIDNPHKLELIEKLLDMGYDINTEDYTGRNMLQRLALKDFSSKPYLRVTELLLDRGIDIKAKDKYLQLPVESAVASNNLPLLRMLLRRGCEMTSKIWPSVANRAVVSGKFECLMVIMKFCIVQELKGKTVNDRVSIFIKSDAVSEYYQLCLEEVNDLKRQIILDTNVSFYDIIFEPTKIVAKHMRNEAVFLGTERNAIETSEFLHDIEEARREALVRIDLEDSCSQMFKHIFNIPELGSEKIIRYLDSQDLRNFLRSLEL